MNIYKDKLYDNLLFLSHISLEKNLPEFSAARLLQQNHRLPDEGCY